MLTRSIAGRMPAFDALHHSWLDLSIRSKTASLNNLDLLANYCVLSTLSSATTTSSR